jgi:lipopolysaccharide export system ATP-binding protein
VLCHGRPEEVLRNPEARKYYFGEGMDVVVRGRPAAAEAAATVSVTAGLSSQGRLAALRNRLSGRYHPPDEAA